MKIKYLSFFFIVLFFGSCNGDNVKKNKTTDGVTEFVNTLRLKSPWRATLYSEGTLVPIKIITRRNRTKIDSICLFSDDVLFETIRSDKWTTKWKLKKGKMGRRNLKIYAYHPDGTIGLLNTYINVKSNTRPINITAEVVKQYHHEYSSYTQGLVFHDGFLYENTGQYGQSTLNKIDLESGKVIKSIRLDDKYFGEGICILKDKILQLTWTSGDAFIRNANTLELEKTIALHTKHKQGWGVTSDGESFIVSDGTELLTFINPTSFKRTKILEVYDNKGKVIKINELEYINGKIYANVWMKDYIITIDPNTGRVLEKIDLMHLFTNKQRAKLVDGDEVLNGIAWDKDNKRLFVTGKRWPKLFQIKLLQ